VVNPALTGTANNFLLPRLKMPGEDYKTKWGPGQKVFVFEKFFTFDAGFL